MPDTFVSRTTDVTLSDIVVEGCLFAVSGAVESVIGVEKCNSELARGTVRLHRIGFRENRFFGGAVAIQANASSCSKLEIEEFDFHANTCNGVCGVLLAKENRLQNITIKQNRLISSLPSGAGIIWAPPQSSSSGDKIRAFENRSPIIQMEGGFFNLSNSNFTKNSVTGEGDESISACVQLKDASILIRGCSFEENEASYGVVINARRSNITLEDCLIRGNVAQMKGTIFLRTGSSLTIDSCRFSSNRAAESGGAVNAQQSELNVTYLICSQNEAGLAGGCLYIDAFSSLKISDSVLERNRARSGGALFLKDASAVIVSSSVLSNRADKRGGGIRSIDSHIIANELTADGNRAEIGGGSISITSKSKLTVHDSVFKNGVSHIGGAVKQGENSLGRFINVTFVNNLADNAGGSISARGATLIIQNSDFRDGADAGFSYALDGGFLSATHNSSVLVENASMTNGTANTGGAIALRTSIFKAKELNVSNCTSDFFGGGVNADASKLICRNCLFESNTAEGRYYTGGGAISASNRWGRESFIQLQDSRVLNNSAELGGNLLRFALTEHPCWFFGRGSLFS